MVLMLKKIIDMIKCKSVCKPRIKIKDAKDR